MLADAENEIKELKDRLAEEHATGVRLAEGCKRLTAELVSYRVAEEIADDAWEDCRPDDL